MNYIIESLFEGKWVKIKEDNLSFCKGWLDCKSYQMPRNALRIVSQSGKVVQQIDEKTELGIGMVAGWPTAEQYEAAADRALKQAERIRKALK